VLTSEAFSASSINLTCLFGVVRRPRSLRMHDVMILLSSVAQEDLASSNIPNDVYTPALNLVGSLNPC